MTPIASPAEHEQNRIRDAQGGSCCEHRRNRAEEPEDDDAVLQIEVHRLMVPKRFADLGRMSRPRPHVDGAVSAGRQ